MDTDRVVTKIEGGIADVRMVRVEKRNAVDLAMFQALVDTGERLKTEKGLRAVVLSGEGKAFCSGLDTGNFAQMAGGEWKDLDTFKNRYGNANLVQYASLVWREIPVPVIAAIHGVAIGAGFQLALGSDMRYVTSDVKMSIMEIKWGLIPDMAANVLLRGLARGDVIRELMYTGRIFSGSEALAYGLATRVCTDPLAEALATAKEIAGKNPHAIRAGKRLINLAENGSEKEILLAEEAEQTALLFTPNQVEAVMANMENREPRFSDID